MSKQKRTTDVVSRIEPPFGSPYVFVLAVVQGQDRHAVFRLTQKETFLGADPAQSDLVINDPQISGRHIMVRVNGTLVSLIDQDSTNGTLLNENPIGAGKPVRLKHADEIQIGRTRLMYMACKFRE